MPALAGLIAIVVLWICCATPHVLGCVVWILLIACFAQHFISTRNELRREARRMSMEGGSR